MGDATNSEHSFQQIDDYIYRHAGEDHDPWKLMETICEEIGPHPAGSPAMARARRYLETKLKELGAVGERNEDVAVRLWDPGEPELELLGRGRRAYDCLQHLYTASADLSLPLVDVGDGTSKDLKSARSRVQGAALLMKGFEIIGGKFLPVIARILLAHEAGAKAIIFGNTEAIDLPALQVPDFRENTDVPIPCVAVSGGVADELAAAASGGSARIRVKTDGFARPGACANLIADLGPDELPAETIILSGHLDSYWNAPGGLDNLTGVATVYAIARLLAPFQKSFRRTLRIIAFTAEELGFLGSKSYVSRHKEELENVRFVVNLDSLFPATARGTAVMWSPQMRDYINRAFDKADRQVDVRNHYCASSDYLPFMLQGVPACRPADWEDTFPAGSHTEKDDLGNVRADWIRLNAMVYAQLLAQMLIDPDPLPARRLTMEEVREQVQKEDVAEGLRLMGFEQDSMRWGRG